MSTEGEVPPLPWDQETTAIQMSRLLASGKARTTFSSSQAIRLLQEGVHATLKGEEKVQIAATDLISLCSLVLLPKELSDKALIEKGTSH